MAAAKKNKDFLPEIVALYCRQCLDAEERPQEGARQAKGFSARLVMLPCSSKVEAYQMLKVLEQGVDGVLLVGCPEKSCRFLVGSRRAEKRLTRAGQLLDQVGMGAGRLALKRAADLTTADILALAGQLAEQVKTLGPNPMKGDSL